MRSRIMLGVIALAGMGVLTGCQDLTVPNTNEPDRLRALSSGADVQTLVVSGWRDLFQRWHRGSAAYNPFPLIADEMSGTYANDAALELSSEPRVAFNNNTTADAHSLSSSPWGSFYSAISSANDGMYAISTGLKIRDGEVDNTSMVWAFGKWIQAMGHGWVSLLFDQGFVFHQGTELPENLDDVLATLPLVPYEEVRDSAIRYMEVAMDSLTARPLAIPETWIFQRPRTGAELARVGHSFIAQLYVYGARTPEERAALPWETILSHIEQGITEDFEVDLGPSGEGRNSSLLSRMQTTGTFSAWGDYKLIGPADVSGNFAAWLATPIAERQRFLITTPDKRITGATPASNGSYFRYRADNIFVPDRGTYHQSHYQWRRNEGRSSSGTWPIISLDEMNLIKAEALYYLNRRDEAAALVNITRTRSQRTQRITSSDPPATTFPGLPPVTADGVTPAADCVPRLDGKTCADLLGAIMYERMIEAALHTSYRGYLDSRGWGRLPEGTFLHLPIPGRELVALAMPIYSFGGIGGPGAAKCSQPFCN